MHKNSLALSLAITMALYVVSLIFSAIAYNIQSDLWFVRGVISLLAMMFFAIVVSPLTLIRELRKQGV